MPLWSPLPEHWASFVDFSVYISRGLPCLLVIHAYREPLAYIRFIAMTPEKHSCN